jgi:diguanylate cyclase (GGDEF)-like protein
MPELPPAFPAAEPKWLSLAGEVLGLLDGGEDALPAALLARINAHLPPGCLLVSAAAASPYLTPEARPLPVPVPSSPQHECILVAPSGSAGAAELAEGLSSLLHQFWYQRRQWAALHHAAHTDELTGLANSRRFRAFLNDTLAWAQRTGLPVTLLLFDIDSFKSYNERYGHGAGDRILIQVADLLRRCSRADDLVARLSGGGDEFAVVFWDKDGPRRPRSPGGLPVASPVQVFERFKRRLDTTDFPDLGPGGLGQLTISAGMAVYPRDAADAEGLIAKADEALMFHAKRLGKNRLHIVGPDDQR